MTEVQIDLIIFGSIIILNLIITFLYKKYKSNQQIEEKKGIDLGNYSPLVRTSSTSFSYMPRVPFLILRHPETKSIRKIIIIHNVLCVLVYSLFIIAIMLIYKTG